MKPGNLVAPQANPYVDHYFLYSAGSGMMDKNLPWYVGENGLVLEVKNKMIKVLTPRGHIGWGRCTWINLVR